MITQHIAISMTFIMAYAINVTLVISPTLNDTVPCHLMGYMMTEVTGLPT